MRVMRPVRGLATRRRASVAAALGLLLTTAACATAVPQGQAPATSRRHRGTAREKPGTPIDALAAAEPMAAGAGTGAAALTLAPARVGWGGRRLARSRRASAARGCGARTCRAVAVFLS